MRDSYVYYIYLPPGLRIFTAQLHFRICQRANRCYQNTLGQIPLNQISNLKVKLRSSYHTAKFQFSCHRVRCVYL